MSAAIPGMPVGPGPAAGPTGAAAIEDMITKLQPIAANVANFAKDHKLLKQRAGLLNNTDDVQFFRFKRLVRALTSDEYLQKAKDPKNKLMPITDEKQATEVSKLLVQCQLIVPVEKLHYREIKAVKKWKPHREKPTLKPSSTANLAPDAYFAWKYNKPSPYMALYGVLMLVGIFAVVLYPLWPRKMKIGVWYLSMAALGLIGLFFVIAIIRLFLYIFTWAAGKPLWIFPNLFADCGVIESFIPYYEWEKPKKKKTKKRKGVDLKEVE